MKERKYPVGIQDFKVIREGGYVYIDKTSLLYQLTQSAKYYFINRPRRFGKSLLLSTLAAYFEGRKELFEGLAISELEKDWPSHPVLRFDFSTGKYNEAKTLADDIHQKLLEYERQYALKQEELSINVRMRMLIREVYRLAGKQVVILIDEYDSAMLYNAHRPEMQDTMREMMRNLFAPIKEADPMLRFVLFTGITKFSQMSVFSELNNLLNISMLPQYEALCGITEEELCTQLRPDVEQLAEKRGKNPEQTHTDLKAMYDGYHFSHKMTDIYNPFSLLKCFMTGEMESYWFASATPTSLITLLRDNGEELTDLEGIPLNAEDFDIPVDGKIDNPVPIIYQSGYLTIKSARMGASGMRYTLGFPNREVRTGFAKALLVHIAPGKVSIRSAIAEAYERFYESDDLTDFMEALKVFFSAYPYDISNNNERHYQSVLYTLLVSFGADVRAEQPTNRGRIDIVLKMPKTIYIIELKHDHSADEAVSQIRDRGYAESFRIESRSVCLVGINFSSKERNITEWKSEKMIIHKS